MFHFFACLRHRVTSEVFTTKFVPIAIVSVAIFLVIAIIACTAAKAFEEQTWTAFVILLVVSIQVLGSSYFVRRKWHHPACVEICCANIFNVSK